MEISKYTNANLPNNSEGSVTTGSGNPENGGQRQDSQASTTQRYGSGNPENGGQRQVSSRSAGERRGSGNPENGGQYFGREKSSGVSGNADQVRRYNFKLYPNKAQESALQRQAVLLAVLWNAALEQRETQWAQECQRKPKGERKGISKYDQGRDLKLIRADDPEYAGMGAATMNLCLIALDDAFRAFFKRAKGGAGKSSGYPRYKSPFAIEKKGADCTVWHREHRKGWRLDQAGHHFRVYAKGIPGTIRARGKFPVPVDGLELRDMRLVRVSGVWSCSIVVKMNARREPGKYKAEIEFDLIDEFARVKIGANGQCLTGWPSEFHSSGERITPENHRDDEVAPADTRELGGDDRIVADGCGGNGPADTRRKDAIQSSRDTRFKKFSNRWRREKKRIDRMEAKEARRRREALHLWTTRLVSEASELTVICPPIKESTKTARGNDRFHGAAVKPVASLNRHVLAQAPAMAIQMLEYKATEAGIPFARITPDEHALAIGRELPMATKAARKASRQIRRMANGNS